MVVIYYEPTAFQRSIGDGIIVAVVVIFLVFHVLLISNFLRNEKARNKESIKRMVVVTSIFWITTFFPLVLGIEVMSSDGIEILLLIPILLLFFGAFLLCSGLAIAYYFDISNPNK